MQVIKCQLNVTENFLGTLNYEKFGSQKILVFQLDLVNWQYIQCKYISLTFVYFNANVDKGEVKNMAVKPIAERMRVWTLQ